MPKRNEYIKLPDKVPRQRRCDFCMNKATINVWLGGARWTMLCKECKKYLQKLPRFNKRQYAKDVKNFLKKKQLFKKLKVELSNI